MYSALHMIMRVCSLQNTCMLEAIYTCIRYGTPHGERLLSCELYCKAFGIGVPDNQPTNQPTNLASDLLLNEMVLPLVVEDHMNLLRTRTTDIGA